MTALWPILAMGAGVYLLRLIGLTVPRSAMPPAFERALRFVPVALLSALVVSSLAGRTVDGAAGWIAAAGAALVVWRTRRLWACIVSGMALYWLTRGI